jgi:hypothetical protein
MDYNNLRNINSECSEEDQQKIELLLSSDPLGAPVPPEYPIVLKRPSTSKKSKIPGSTALPIWMGKKRKNNGL